MPKIKTNWSKALKDWETLSPEDKVRRWHHNVEIDGEHFLKPLYAEMMLRSVEVLSKNTARVVFELDSSAYWSNAGGNVHGGAQAAIFDIVTTLALAPIARPGYWMYAGVSRTLNVTYLRPGPVGEKIFIEAEVIHAGKSLAAIRGVMKRAKDGAVISTCEHNKASTDPEVRSKI